MIGLGNVSYGRIALFSLLSLTLVFSFAAYGFVQSSYASAIAPTISSTDLWEGATVTATSGLQGGLDTNLFDGTGSELYFLDSTVDGGTDFIEWETVVPVTISSYGLHALHDGPGFAVRRGFDDGNRPSLAGRCCAHGRRLDDQLYR
jgi:hypothetical protein